MAIKIKREWSFRAKPHCHNKFFLVTFLSRSSEHINKQTRGRIPVPLMLLWLLLPPSRTCVTTLMLLSAFATFTLHRGEALVRCREQGSWAEIIDNQMSLAVGLSSNSRCACALVCVYAVQTTAGKNTVQAFVFSSSGQYSLVTCVLPKSDTAWRF